MYNAGQGAKLVHQEAEEEGRQGLPVGGGGLPHAGGQGALEAREVARVPRRAGEGVRRPDRPLPGRGRRRERGREGRVGAGHRDAPPHEEDRQARRGQGRDGGRRPQRLPPPRPGDMGLLREEEDLEALLLRPVPHPRASRLEPDLRPRLEVGRVGVEEEVPQEVRVHARRHLPLPRPPGRRLGRAGQAHERLARGGARPEGPVAPLLRRHQLLVRDRRRGRRRGRGEGAQEEGRPQGAQAGGHRADGAAHRQGRDPRRLPALPRQRERHVDDGAHDGPGGAAQGRRPRRRARRGGGRQGPQHLREHRPLHPRRERLRPQPVGEEGDRGAQVLGARRGGLRGLAVGRLQGERAGSPTRPSTSRARTAGGTGSWSP